MSKKCIYNAAVKRAKELNRDLIDNHPIGVAVRYNYDLPSSERFRDAVGRLRPTMRKLNNEFKAKNFGQIATLNTALSDGVGINITVLPAMELAYDYKNGKLTPKEFREEYEKEINRTPDNFLENQERERPRGFYMGDRALEEQERRYDELNSIDITPSPRITYDQLENLWRKEGFELGKEYSHTEFIEFIEKNGSPEALAVWNLIKDKLDQFPATIMILHQTDPRFESVMNKSKSILKGVPFAGVYRKNQIILNSTLLSVNSERAVKTAVHELIHTVTGSMLHLHEYINSDRFLKTQKSSQDRWSKVYDTFSTEQKNTLREIFELFEEIQKSELLEGHYGMTNIQEFFAELANPKFIEELKKLEVTKSPKEKSFFERLVELVYKLFGKDVSYGADSYILDSLSTLLEGDVDYNKYITAEPLFDSLEKTDEQQKSQERLNQVQEIFNENPELANQVYEVLGLNTINESEITYTDEEGNPCAKMGLTNTVKGADWKIVKDFKGKPKHSNGGVDITISDKGVSMRKGGNDIKAKYGLLIINNN